MMKIIAFGHRKRVGKDIAAKFLINHLRQNNHGINVQKAGFADKLKNICYDLYHWAGLMNDDYYEENPGLKEIVLPELGKSPRQIYIEVGNYMRQVYPNTWVDYLFNRSYDILIIKDVRFPTEADAILQKGGKIYRIDRPGIPLDKDGADDQLLTYPNWSDTIVNDSDLATLHTRVIEVTKEYLDG